MDALSNIFPIIEDVQNEYRLYRQRGMSRDEAYKLVLKEYKAELDDDDDRPQVWIGLAKVTGSRGELTEEIYQQANEAFNDLLERVDKLYGNFEIKKSLQESCAKICDRSKIGDQANYSKKRIYKPDWQIGDTFVYDSDSDEYQELQGKAVLLRKVGEVQHPHGDWLQLMYLTICEREHIPINSNEMNSLGYIPILKLTNRDGSMIGYEYQCHLWTSSAIKVKQYRIKKVGCFADIKKPKYEVEHSPLWTSYLILPGDINLVAVSYLNKYGITDCS